jgi:hypothetical protein
MPLPEPLETATVRGYWASPVDGKPLRATATLRALVEARSAAANVLLAGAPEHRILVDGAAEWLNVVLADSAGLSNPITYQLDITGDGYHRRYFYDLRKADAVSGVIQLADVTPAEQAPALVVYVLASTLGQPGGVATLGNDGILTAAQRPAGGGGGAVTSVDGRTGVVTLGDLYIDPTELAAGLAGKANTSHTHIASQVTDFNSAVDARADARIQLIVGSAPAALDTLNELAAALGDDPNFAATTITALAGKQPLDADLTAIAGLAPADGALLQRIAGAWNAQTPAQVKTSLLLTKVDVGLSAVDNTSDLDKPISTATQTALNAKAPSSHQHLYDLLIGSYGWIGASGDPFEFMQTGTPGSGDHLIGFVPCQPGALIAGVEMISLAAATHSASATPAQVRLYDFDATLLGTTPDDPTLWAATGKRQALLSTPIAAPADGRLFVGASFGGFSGAALAVHSGNTIGVVVAALLGGRRRSIFASSGAGLPTTFNPVSYGFTTDWYPLFGILRG